MYVHSQQIGKSNNQKKKLGARKLKYLNGTYKHNTTHQRNINSSRARSLLHQRSGFNTPKLYQKPVSSKQNADPTTHVRTKLDIYSFFY